MNSVLKTQVIPNTSNPLRRARKAKMQKGKSHLSEEAQAMVSAMLSYKEEIES